MAYNYDRITQEANAAGVAAVKKSGVKPHPFGCGWGWVQVPLPPKPAKSGLATWMKYRNGNEGCDWGHGYGGNGGFSYHFKQYGQSADQAYIHAEAFAAYVNEVCKDDPGTPAVSAQSKLD
tara:strand:- start:22447 stop:22809 length:363 start_codon:yes stop_codon:yes gene_type:complete